MKGTYVGKRKVGVQPNGKARGVVYRLTLPHDWATDLPEVYVYLTETGDLLLRKSPPLEVEL